MRTYSAALSLAFLLAAIAAGEEKAPSWVKVNEKAPWQARDSSGEVVFKDFVQTSALINPPQPRDSPRSRARLNRLSEG